MGKPTQEQLQEALETAISMREHNHDPHFVAKALLNSNYRLGQLEQVLALTRDYLRGQDEMVHARLVKAIDHYQELENRTAADDHQRFGLD